MNDPLDSLLGDLKQNQAQSDLDALLGDLKPQQAKPIGPPPAPVTPQPMSSAFSKEADWLRGQAASRAPKPIAPNPMAPPPSSIRAEAPGPIAPTVETKATGQSNAPVPGRIPGMERLGGAVPGVPLPKPTLGEVNAPSLPGDIAGGFVRGAGNAAMAVPRALSRIPGGFRDDIEALQPLPSDMNPNAGFVGPEQRAVEQAMQRKRTANMISRAEQSALPDAPITVPGKFAEALGSTAPYMAAGVLGGNAGTATLGVLGGVDEAMTRADMSGKPMSDEQRALVGAGGAAIGSTEALPFARLFGRLKGAGVVAEAADEAAIVKQLFPGWKEYLGSAAKQGVEEAAQEGFSNVAQDALEASYGGRPVGKIGADFVENAGTGGAVGVFVDLLTTLAGSRAGRARMAQAGINPDAFRAWVEQRQSPVESAQETLDRAMTPPPPPQFEVDEARRIESEPAKPLQFEVDEARRITNQQPAQPTPAEQKIDELQAKVAELEAKVEQAAQPPAPQQLQNTQLLPPQDQQVAPVAPANQPVAENEPPAPQPVEAPAPLPPSPLGSQQAVAPKPELNVSQVAAPEPREEVIQNTAESPAPGGVDAPASPGPVQPAGPAAPARVDATPTPDPDIFRVPTSSLAIDPVRFQYKVEGIGQGGVGDELKSAKKWNPKLAGVIAVWRDPKDGKTYVVNGHHRFELASRLNVPELKVWFIDAPDAQTARAEGALMNIAEGRGTAIDAAKFMRDTGRSAADIEAEGLSLKGAKARDGAALANLAPSLFDDVVHGGLKQERAVIIGEGLPNHEDQLAAVAVLRNAEQRGKRLTNEEVKELIRRTAQAERKVEQQDTLFGVQEMTQNLALEEAQLSNFVRTKLGNEKKLFSTVGSQSAADRLGAAGNKIDADMNRQIAQQADQALAVYDKLSLSAGPISDALREGARRVASGEKLDSVKESVYSAVRDSVARLLGQNQQAGVRAADRPAMEDGGGGAQKGNASGAPATGTGRAGNRVEQTPDGPQETLVTDIEARESQLAAKRDRTTPLAEVPFSLVQEDGPPAPAAPDDRQSLMFGDDESTPAFRRDTGNPAMRPGTPRPAQTQQTQQPSGAGRMISRSEIVKELSEMLNDLPIRTGNIAQRGAAGAFDVRQNVIRSKNALDLETISHEIGHGLHKYLWGSEPIVNKGQPTGKYKLKTQPLDQFKGELGPLDYDQTKKRPFEGFAEYIRLRLTDPAVAKTKAPQFHAWFENTMSQQQHADMKQVLDDARDRVQRWIQQPGAAKVAASINVKPEKDSLRDRMNKWTENAYFNWVDDKIALKRTVDLFEKLGAKVSTGENAYRLARMISAAATRAHHALFEGTVGADNKVNGESLAAILQDVKKRDPKTYNPAFKKLAERDGVILEGDGMDDFRIYLVAKRATNYAKRGLETGFEKAWVNEAIAATETPELKAAAKRLYEYQDRVLQYMVDKGAFSAELADRFRSGDEFYVPMYRVMDNSKERAILGRKMIDNNSPIMKRKGSTREIIDPLESIVRNTYTFMSFADRNDVAQALVKQAAKVQDQGWLVESGIVRPMKRTAFNLSEVSKEIKDVLAAEGIDASDIDFDQMAAIYRPNMDPKRGDNIVRVIVDGEPKLFQFDPSLIEAMDVNDADSMKMHLGVLEKFKNALTFGATAGNPEFVITNWLRDQTIAGIQSRNGYIPFIDGVWGAYKLFTDPKLVEEWMLNGGATAAMMPLTRENLQKSVQRMTSSRKELTLKHPAEALALLKDVLTYAGTQSEQATRVAEFWKAKKRGKDSMEAAFDSRDVTLDFERAGRIGKFVNRLIPFFQVAINGADRFMEMHYSSDKGMRNRAMMTAAGLAMASLALWYLNRDDEEYQRVEAWKRNMYWLIPTKGLGLRGVFGPFMRIPKPPLWGMLYGSLVERIADDIAKKNPDAFDDFALTFFGQAMPQIQLAAVKPAVEVMTNYNFFTDRPIESAVMEGRSPVNRYTWRTSEAAKSMSRGFNQMGVQFSPAKIDHLLLGYTAGLGRISITAAEELSGVRDNRPSMGPEDRPIFRAFATPESPFISTDYKRFSKVLRDLKQKREDFKFTSEDKDKMSGAEQSKLKKLEALQREFSQLSARQYKIVKDKNLSRDQKRAEIDKLSRKRDEILKRNRALYQK